MSNSRSTSYKIYKNVLAIEEFHFQAGICTVSSQAVDSDINFDHLVKNNNLYLKSRRFHVKTLTPGHQITGPVKKARDLLSAINHPIDEVGVVVENLNRRDEVFIPLIFSDDKFGLYVYPWTSSNKKNICPKNEKFQGFNEFVTAVCMLGSSLKGVDQFGATFPLIKHNIELHPQQKIVAIKYNPRLPQPFKAATFIELERLAYVINQFSNVQAPKKLKIHLPWIDYILFGLNLFAKGKIELKAISNLITTIFNERNLYMDEIKKIFMTHHIAVTFESPFENLFNLSQVTNSNVCESIFSSLDIPYEEPTKGTIDSFDDEKFSNLILSKLLTNNYNEAQREIWQIFAASQKTINNIEDLFKHANALILATSSFGKNDYEVCSLLPLTEKQIQVEYSKMTFPSVFMMTFLEPFYSYNSDLKEYSLFYSDSEQNHLLNKLIQKKGLIQDAYSNIFKFWQSASDNQKLYRPTSMESTLNKLTR